MKITVTLIFVVFFCRVRAQGENCYLDKDVLTCRCISNEELELFYDSIHKITSLNVFSCASVILTNFMGSNMENTLSSIRVENITNTLDFCPQLFTNHLTRIEIMNVKNLAKFVDECTFHRFSTLDHFHIENTRIGEFKQSFNQSKVMKFKLKNVTILDLQGLEFSSLLHGTSLEITDSYVNVTTNTSLFFQTFANIRIANSTFNFPRGGAILISGRHIYLKNNTFLKVSVDVTGTERIHLSDTCAEGHGSAMRLHVTNPRDGHKSIFSHGNKMPSEVIYIPKIDANDRICPGAKCDCLPIIPTVKQTITTSNYGTINREFSVWFIIFASGILTKI